MTRAVVLKRPELGHFVLAAKPGHMKALGRVPWSIRAYNERIGYPLLHSHWSLRRLSLLQSLPRVQMALLHDRSTIARVINRVRK